MLAAAWVWETRAVHLVDYFVGQARPRWSRDSKSGLGIVELVSDYRLPMYSDIGVKDLELTNVFECNTSHLLARGKVEDP